MYTIRLHLTWDIAHNKRVQDHKSCFWVQVSWKTGYSSHRLCLGLCKLTDHSRYLNLMQQANTIDFNSKSPVLFENWWINLGIQFDQTQWNCYSPMADQQCQDGSPINKEISWTYTTRWETHMWCANISIFIPSAWEAPGVPWISSLQLLRQSEYNWILCLVKRYDFIDTILSKKWWTNL